MTPSIEAFVAALPPDEATIARDDPDLAAALQVALERGAAARPDIVVPAPAVALQLARHADDHRALSTWLASRNMADVHLACGIARGVPAAIATFEQRLTPDMRAAAARLVDEDTAAEIVATVREKLVVGADARGPRIADYGGDGELAVWVRVIVIRAAVSQLRTDRRHVPADERLWDLASPNADPAIRLLKRESAALIKVAFHEALATLSPRQRNLLRQHLIDGLTIDELGALYQIHRVTAARWLTAARGDLWSHVRRHLRQTIGITDSAIGGMLDDIRSTLDLSIERALGS